jgi:hypothetical protein
VSAVANAGERPGRGVDESHIRGNLMSNIKGRERTMLNSYVKPLTLAAASAAILLASTFVARADDQKFPPCGKTNINLAVASNFYGAPAIQ